MTANEIETSDPAVFAFWLRFWRWVVAVLEVVGGLYGLYGVIRLAVTSHYVSLPVLVLFVAAVCGGGLLALRQRGGVVISMVIQALQLVQISTAGMIYSFTCGLQLLVGPRQTENGPDLGFGLSWGGRIFASLNPSSGMVPSGAITGVNVAAFLAIICLLYVRAEERKAKSELTTSGTADALQSAGIWPPAPKP